MLFAVTLPSDLGRIQETHTGSKNKTIIFIEEAHVEYGAQKAIAAILKDLIKNESVRWIFVEGGWGPVSLSYLRDFGTPEGRQQIAEKYLKEGKISGEEYLDITSNLPMQLWGIEDSTLYAENMKAFFALSAGEDRIKKAFLITDEFLNALQNKILSENLRVFLEKRAAFQEEEIPLLDYLKDVQKIAGNDAFSKEPVLQKLQSLIENQNNLENDFVEFEKNKLMQALSRRLTKPEFEYLASLQKQKGLEAEAFFFAEFLKAGKQLNLKKEIRLHLLEKHAELLNASAKLDAGKIFSEIKQSEDRYLVSNAGNDEALKFIQFILRYETLKKLFRIQLDPENYRQINEDTAFSNLGPWKNYLDEMAKKYQLPFASGGFDFLSENLSHAKQFYLSAYEREQAMVENTVKKLDTLEDASVVLIAGGFHSSGLAKAFKGKGYGFIKISPRFDLTSSSETQHKHYLNVLKYKWEPEAFKDNPLSIVEGQGKNLSPAPQLQN